MCWGEREYSRDVLEIFKASPEPRELVFDVHGVRGCMHGVRLSEKSVQGGSLTGKVDAAGAVVFER